MRGKRKWRGSSWEGEGVGPLGRHQDPLIYGKLVCWAERVKAALLLLLGDSANSSSWTVTGRSNVYGGLRIAATKNLDKGNCWDKDAAALTPNFSVGSLFGAFHSGSLCCSANGGHATISDQQLNTSTKGSRGASCCKESYQHLKEPVLSQPVRRLIGIVAATKLVTWRLVAARITVKSHALWSLQERSSVEDPTPYRLPVPQQSPSYLPHSKEV